MTQQTNPAFVRQCQALIPELEDKIKKSERFGDREDGASWGMEEGILLARDKARIALTALQAIVVGAALVPTHPVSRETPSYKGPTPHG